MNTVEVFQLIDTAELTLKGMETQLQTARKIYEEAEKEHRAYTKKLVELRKAGTQLLNAKNDKERAAAIVKIQATQTVSQVSETESDSVEQQISAQISGLSDMITKIKSQVTG